MALRAANRPIREWHVCVPTPSSNFFWTLEAKFRADDLFFHELILPGRRSPHPEPYQFRWPIVIFDYNTVTRQQSAVRRRELIGAK